MSENPQCFPPTPRKQYPSVRQKAKLFDLLEADLDLKRGKFSQTFTRQVATARWKRIGAQLNAIPGATKTYEEWRKTWQDIKSKAKKRQAEMNAANRTGGAGEPSTDQEDEQSASNDTKLKKGKDIVFSTVKQACVDLVKKHGHSVSLFDEEGFRTILQLLPITAKQTATITSEYIQKYLDLSGDEDETGTSMQGDQETSDIEEATEPIVSITVKGEIEEEQCNCDGCTEDSSKGHQLACPVVAPRQPYWNYFEVTTDEATCQVCDERLNWTNITKLKEHLVQKHPTTEFLDDDAEFARGPGSDVWSLGDCSEEDILGDPLPTTPAAHRKRKRTSGQPTSGVTGFAESGGGVPSRSVGEGMKTEVEGLSRATRSVIVMALERFKCLDSFGQYVAGLMKLIPNEKCLKLQVQIVHRLLQEQAAAG